MVSDQPLAVVRRQVDALNAAAASLGWYDELTGEPDLLDVERLVGRQPVEIE